MKITYIIGPFASPKYLIRCINSILRQTVKDNEIIVADNRFEMSAELNEFLNTTESVRLISDKPESEIDKINEALAMADDNSLINIVSAGTVVSPITSETVCVLDADIIAVSHALKNNLNYDVTLINDNPFIDSSKADIQSVFFKKKFLNALRPELIAEKLPFELWMDRLLLDGATHAVSGEIGFYFGLERLKHKVDDAEYILNNKAEILEITKKAVNANSKAGLFLFDKYLSELYKLLLSTKYEPPVKAEIFALIKELGGLAEADELAKRIFELYLGEDIESVSKMDAEAYLFYADRILMFGNKPLTKARLEQMAAEAVAPIEKRFDTKQYKQLQKIKALEAKVKTLSAEVDKIEKDPQKNVPVMFAQGKLGFRVLLRSFMAWLKRKLGIKRK